MITKVTDTTGEIYHINPMFVIYLKERPHHGLWKIVMYNGEAVMTKDKVAAKSILDSLNKE